MTALSAARYSEGVGTGNVVIFSGLRRVEQGTGVVFLFSGHVCYKDKMQVHNEANSLLMNANPYLKRLGKKHWEIIEQLHRFWEVNPMRILLLLLQKIYLEQLIKAEIVAMTKQKRKREADPLAEWQPDRPKPLPQPVSPAGATSRLALRRPMRIAICSTL